MDDDMLLKSVYQLQTVVEKTIVPQNDIQELEKTIAAAALLLSSHLFDITKAIYQQHNN